MSWSTYYSPLGIGFVLGFVAVVAQPSSLGVFGPSLALVLLAALLVGVTWGVSFQLVMTGIQGVSAQVVPVPGGRSIRNRHATAIGLLLLAGSACGTITSVWRAVSYESFAKLAWIIASLGLASFLAALVLYIWCIPNAERDFE
jgi:hypothetical protein